MKTKKFIGIIEHDDLLRIYSLYSFFFRKEIIIYGKYKLNKISFLNKNISVEEDFIGKVHSGWYELQKFLTFKKEFIHNLALEKNFFVRLQCWLFRSDKVVNFYKQYYANVQYLLLRDLVLAKENGIEVCFLLPYLKTYRVLAKEHLKREEYSYSFLITFLYLIYASKQFIGLIVKNLLSKPVFHKKNRFKVIKRLGWGFHGKDLRDDLLVDDIQIKKKDIVFFMESYSNKRNEKKCYEDAIKSGYSVILVDKSFNINRSYFYAIQNNILFPVAIYLPLLFFSPFLLFSFKQFNSKSFSFTKIFSFVNVDKFWSIGNWHDIAETIVANNHNTTSFVYSWADNAQSYFYEFIYTVHDDVFMWGPLETKFKIQSSMHKNIYTIGCLFSNSIHESKEKVLRRLGLDDKKPILVFYDSPVSNNMRYPQSLFDEFREIIIDIEKKYPNIQLVLKPKKVTDEYKNFFENTSVNLFDSSDISLGDIINISTINIGMGFVAPVTISIIMNKNSLIYDTAGNYDSPLSKYQGSIVFRDKQKFLEKIDEILEVGNFRQRPIEEIHQYNIYNTNPIDIIRVYVANGTVEEKYRYID